MATRAVAGVPAPVSHAGLYEAYDRMVADQERELHERHEVRSVADRFLGRQARGSSCSNGFSRLAKCRCGLSLGLPLVRLLLARSLCAAH